MKKYIDKSALVAELNRLIAELVEEGEDTMFEQGRISAFEDVKVFISHTLEEKEVDLEKEYERYYEQERNIQTFKLAKHFFELGLKAQKGE
jgi:hypothetical protein